MQTREQAVRKVQFAEYEPMDIMECHKCHVRWIVSRAAERADYFAETIGLHASAMYDVAECACGERFAVREGTEFIFGIPKR